MNHAALRGGSRALGLPAGPAPRRPMCSCWDAGLPGAGQRFCYQLSSLCMASCRSWMLCCSSGLCSMMPASCQQATAPTYPCCAGRCGCSSSWDRPGSEAISIIRSHTLRQVQVYTALGISQTCAATAGRLVWPAKPAWCSALGPAPPGARKRGRCACMASLTSLLSWRSDLQLSYAISRCLQT